MVEWVNLSNRGGTDGVFQGVAGLLGEISRRRSPRKIPKSSHASPRKTLSFPTLLLRLALPKCIDWIIWVKEEGRTGFSEGFLRFPRFPGFPLGLVFGKSLEAALPDQGKLCPFQIFYSDLRSISNTVNQSTEVSRRVNFFWKLFQLTSDDKLQILTNLSFPKLVVQNTFVINYFAVGPLWKVEKPLKDCAMSWSKSWVEYFFLFLGPIFRAI